VNRTGQVVAVALDGQHRFSKLVAEEITLVQGIGVEGDAHAGVTVQHRSRVAADPTQPNLRQVHLIHAELHDELRGQGFEVAPGIDLLALPRGTRLTLGPGAEVEITGLRNPCQQINGFRPRLLQAVLDRDAVGNVRRRAGIMGIVLRGGVVRPGDAIEVRLPAAPHRALDRV
jgi:hypothetical protein